MRLVQNYLFRQLLTPTLLATLALAVVALLSESLSALDIIVDQRQGLLVFLTVTLLALPQLLSLILPVAVFVAAILALNRLHTEQEIVVCFAGGMSRWNVIAPAVRLAAGCAFLALVLNLWVAPPAAQTLRTTVYNARADLAASLIRPGEFSEPSAGLTVYAQDQTNDGVLKNVFIHQQRPKGATTFMAREGRLAKRNNAPVLILKQGSSQEFSQGGVLNYLSFDEYSLDLAPYLPKADLVHYKTSDRNLHELVSPDLTQTWEQQNRRKMQAEANSRIAGPLYNITFMMLALAAVIGGPFSRLGYNRRIAIAGAAAVGVRILGFAFQSMAIHTEWVNVMQYVVPVAAAGAAWWVLFHQGGSRRAPARRLDTGLTPAGAI